MATPLCGTSITIPTGLSGELDVLDKYNDLMEATLAEGSLYQRTKDTFYELFKDLDLDSEQKAGMVAESMSKMAIDMSGAAMQTALGWATEERDGEYKLAILQGQALKAQADALVAEATICKIESETQSECAKREVLIAGSLRENGSVTAYDELDPCRPLSLDDTGLKYHQTEMVIAQRYSTLSDSYMKNGTVSIDGSGIPTGSNGEGKVAEDIKFSQRQRISFEDSKRNHAANASSQMISGLIAAEVYTNEHQDLVDQWVAAMEYLNSNSCNPGDPSDCPPVV